jgi:hypothetical protein
MICLWGESQQLIGEMLCERGSPNVGEADSNKV